MRWFGFSLAAAAVSTMASSVPPVAPPQIWQLDWQRNFCTISTGDTATAGLAVWMTPGDPKADVFFIGSPKIIPGDGSADKMTVTLLPGGQSFSADVMNVSAGTHGRALRLMRLKEAFPSTFAKSSEARLAGMKGAVAITGADKAMAALRQCIDDKLTEWGVNAKAYEALRSPPTDVADRLWFTDDDYPAEALAQGEEGNVIARMDVDATGRVTSCAVVVSSGSKSIDDLTCVSAMRKGRFNPAIGADGRPTAAQRIVRVDFQMEG